MADQDPAAAFHRLLLALAEVFSAEERPGGRRAAAAYRAAAMGVGGRVWPEAERAAGALDAAIRAAMESAADPTAHAAAHAAALAARGAHPILRWSAAGLPAAKTADLGPVSPNIAVVELIGPDGMLPAADLRSGLFMLRAGALYPPHAHAAEETYIMLSGAADWRQSDAAPLRCGVGAEIHHRPWVPHAAQTGEAPILAAWRWSGDIRPETYRWLSDPHGG